jgi:beta-glucosidase
LCAFKRVSLKAGEPKTIEINIKADSFALIDKSYQRAVEPGIFTIYTGGSQPSMNNKNVLQSDINISGPTFVIK